MLSIFESVEDDNESIDPKRHRPSKILILGREVVFAEVRDRVEQLAVRGVEAAVGVEDLRGGLLVCRGDDQAVDEIVVDVERRLEGVAEVLLSETRIGGIALAVRNAQLVGKEAEDPGPSRCGGHTVSDEGGQACQRLALSPAGDTNVERAAPEVQGMGGGEGLVLDGQVPDVRPFADRVGTKRLHEIGKAEDLHGGEAVAVGGLILAGRQIESAVMQEARGVLVEVVGEAIAGNDDGIFLETPGRSLLLAGEKLQARRFDGREADLLRPRLGRRGADVRLLAVAGGQRQRGDQKAERR